MCFINEALQNFHDNKGRKKEGGKENANFKNKNELLYCQNAVE